MKNLLPRSLTYRLLLALGLSLLTLGLGQFLLLHSRWESSVQEVEQRVNWNLAQELADTIQPFIDQGKLGQVFRLLNEAMEINPHIDLFLLNAQGRVLFPLDRLQVPNVSLPEVKQFLEFSTNREVPLRNIDPLVREREVIFSVAPLVLHNKEKGYLYANLESKRVFIAQRGVFDSSLLWGALVSTVLLLLAAVLLGSTLLLLITRPFTRLQQAVLSFTAGNLDARCPTEGDDDIAKLGGAINQMADSAKARYEDLESRETLRQHLFADLGHDLGKPLTAMQGYLEQLAVGSEQLSEQEKTEKVEIALRNTKNFGRLLQDLFQLTALESSELKPQIEAFSIAELVLLDVLPEVKPLAEEHNISILTDVPEDIPPVLGDCLMILRVLANLLENAVRHNPSGTKVSLRLSTSEQRVTVEIHDDGPGISEELQGKIFQRYVSQRNEEGVTGLGLAIVKKILQAHGEQIVLRSSPEEGTSFCFSLPVA